MLTSRAAAIFVRVAKVARSALRSIWPKADPLMSKRSATCSWVRPLDFLMFRIRSDRFIFLGLGIGDWGLGFSDWDWGFGIFNYNSLPLFKPVVMRAGNGLGELRGNDYFHGLNLYTLKNMH